MLRVCAERGGGEVACVVRAAVCGVRLCCVLGMHIVPHACSPKGPKGTHLEVDHHPHRLLVLLCCAGSEQPLQRLHRNAERACNGRLAAAATAARAARAAAAASAGPLLAWRLCRRLQRRRRCCGVVVKAAAGCGRRARLAPAAADCAIADGTAAAAAQARHAAAAAAAAA